MVNTPAALIQQVVCTICNACLHLPDTSLVDIAVGQIHQKSGEAGPL